MSTSPSSSKPPGSKPNSILNPLHQNPQILILGAGVTGLSTALSLLASPSTSHFSITLIATHLPGDFSSEYTSPWAGGDWHSHASLADEDADVRRWDGRTYEAWTELLSSKSAPSSRGNEGSETPRQGNINKDLGQEVKTNREDSINTNTNIGLKFTTLRYFWGSHTPATQADGSGIWFSSLVHDFQILDLGQERREGRPVPRDAVFGTSFRTMTFDPPLCLAYLLRRVRDLGGRVVRARVETGGGLEGVVGGLKKLVKENQEEGRDGDCAGDVFAIINCAGLSSRHFLPSNEAEKLFPVRGQTVLVKGEAKDAYTYVSIPSAPSDEVLYVMPRPSGTTVLGGCKQVGNWEEGADAEMGKRIVERVVKDGLAEELRTGGERDGGFEVVRHQVGFRPGRKGGPRVEVERENGGRVGGVWLLHSYGHGSGGFQASVGCAERIVELIKGLL